MSNLLSIIPDVVFAKLLGTMDDGGVCMTFPDPSLSFLPAVFLHFSRARIVNEFRVTCLELSCSTVSTTADFANNSRWMIDEWSSELTLEL